MSLNPWLTIGGLALTVVPSVIGLIFALVRKRTNSWIGRSVGYALDAIGWHFLRFFAHRIGRRASLNRYSTNRLARADASSFMSIPGLGNYKLDIDEAYVPLVLAGPQENTVELANVLAADLRRLLVVGDPGSGKSTFSKKLMRDACLQNLNRGRKSLPVLIELKALRVCPEDEDPGSWLLAQVKKSVMSVEAFDIGSVFDDACRGYGVLVILDGLDEVATSDYARTAEAINGLTDILAGLSSENIVVLTMREQFHGIVHKDFEATFSHVLTVSPFTPSDIYMFLERFPYRERERREATRIYRDLADRPTLRDMCRNPLVLSMYVVRDQQDPEDAAPDTRAAFYQAICEELVIKRRSRQLKLLARTALREEREHVLGELALDNLLNLDRPLNSIPYLSALEVVKTRTTIDSDSEAEQYLYELIKDTGLIGVERDDETLRFAHLSFCEFFGALQAVRGRKDGWEAVRAAHERFQSAKESASRLLEVVPFSIALLPPVERNEALSSLAASVQGTPSDNRLIGRCIAETGLYSHSMVNSYLSHEKSWLLGHEPSDWGTEWRERLHLYLMIMENPSPQSVSEGRDNLYEQLVLGSQDRAVRLFESFAAYDPAAMLATARSMNVDLPKDAPMVCIQAFRRSSAFIDMALAQAREKKTDIFDWVALMGVASLTSARLREDLASRKPDVDLTRALQGTPVSGKWKNAARFVRPSLSRKHAPPVSVYTQCLEAMSQQQPSLPRGADMMSAAVYMFPRVKPTGRLLSDRFLISGLYVGISGIMSAVLALVYFRMSASYRLQFFLFFYFASMLVIFTLMIYTRARRNVYSILLSGDRSSIYGTRLYAPGYFLLRILQPELYRYIVVYPEGGLQRDSS